MSGCLDRDGVLALIVRNMIATNPNPTSLEFTDILGAIPLSNVISAWLDLSADAEIKVNWSPKKMLGCFDKDKHDINVILPLLLSATDNDKVKVFADVFDLLKQVPASTEPDCLDLGDVSKWTRGSVSSIPVSELANVLGQFYVTNASTLASFKTAARSLAANAKFSDVAFGNSLVPAAGKIQITDAMISVLQKVIELKTEVSTRDLLTTFTWQMLVQQGDRKDIVSQGLVSLPDLIAFVGDSELQSQQYKQNLYGWPQIYNRAKSAKFNIFNIGSAYGFVAADFLKITAIKNAITTDSQVLADFNNTFPYFISSVPILERLYGFRQSNGTLSTTLTSAFLTDAEKANIPLLVKVISERSDNGIPAVGFTSATGILPPSDSTLKTLAIHKEVKGLLGLTSAELFDKLPDFSKLLIANFVYLSNTKSIVSNGFKLDGSNVSSLTNIGSSGFGLTEAQVDSIKAAVAGAYYKEYLQFNLPAATTLAEGVANVRKMASVSNLQDVLSSFVPIPNKTLPSPESIFLGSFSMVQIATALLVKSDVTPAEFGTVVDFLSNYVSDSRSALLSQLITLAKTGTIQQKADNLVVLKRIINMALDNFDTPKVKALVTLFGSNNAEIIATLKLYADGTSLVRGQDWIGRAKVLFDGFDPKELFVSGVFGPIKAEWGSLVEGARGSEETVISDKLPLIFRDNLSAIQSIKHNNLVALSTLPSLLSFTMMRKGINPVTGLITQDTTVLGFSVSVLKSVFGAQAVEDALSEVYMSTA